MREVMGKHMNEHRSLLDPQNVSLLRRANYLFHSAHNRCLAFIRYCEAQPRTCSRGFGQWAAFVEVETEDPQVPWT